MSRRRGRSKATGAQKEYARALAGQIGESEASRISRDVLQDPATGKGLDAFESVPDPARPWHQPQRLDSLHSDQVSKLINALLDKAGRAGRRRNNRGR